MILVFQIYIIIGCLVAYCITFEEKEIFEHYIPESEGLPIIPYPMRGCVIILSIFLWGIAVSRSIFTRFVK